jgi:putative intracellular protease/amidase
MLAGKRIAILIEADFEDSELMEPLRTMKELGARETIVGTGSKRNYLGKGGSASISADIVKGRRVTSWPLIVMDLTDAGAFWVDESVVRGSNNLISRKPADIPKFTKAIVAALI